MTERIAVALSGGADSALAASLLLSQGYRVFALHLLLTRDAAALEQVSRARETAGRLVIEFEVVDAVDAFEDRVIVPFCSEYAAGRTPNPCITCNRDIKTGLLLRAAIERGADRLATGHYARVSHHAGRFLLSRAVDHRADQSYFLYAIDPSSLGRLALPLGELTRSEVRSLAVERNLVRGNSSQDICFVGGRDYRRFVAERVPVEAGEIVDTKGRVMGRHRGLTSFTVGQRHQLGVALGRPVYVVRLEPEHNRVVVGSVDELMTGYARLNSLRWLVPQPRGRLVAQARARYRSRCSAAVVTVTGASAVVRFEEPQRAVAPGQSVVLYDGDTVLGGGVVAATGTEEPDGD